MSGLVDGLETASYLQDKLVNVVLTIDSSCQLLAVANRQDSDGQPDTTTIHIRTIGTQTINWL